MKRRLIMVERIMYVDAETPLNCVFTVKIQGAIDPDNLKTALFKIQHKHPLLRVNINDEQTGAPYFITNEDIQPIPVRIIERRPDNNWLTESRVEWHKLFDKKDEPLARLVWIRSDEVSELLLVLPHCICDGTTFITLMRELLSLLDNPDQELPAYTSFNSVDDLMPGSFFADKKKIFKARIFAMVGRLFFFLKATPNKPISGNNYALHWKLGQEQTSALTNSSKKNNTSIHATLCVAFLQAFKQVRGVKANGKVICPVDIRRFIPQIKQDHIFAFAPIAELTIDKKTDTGFWDTASKLKANLIEKIEAMQVHEQLWMGELLHKAVKKMIGFLRTTNGTHDITLSNMGRLDIPEEYRSFEVETIYSPTLAFPWRNPNTLVASTYKNQVDFTLMSNDAFLSQAEAMQIRDKAMEILLTNVRQFSYA